ncbi:MAG: amino acid permease [Alphaproteobacteria bacterium]|nr:amino acid permease [Alphaproteobacteria bacterium]
MSKASKAAAEIATGETAPHLGRALASRHVAMISIGGIIGAGLFVGSSAAIATVGPAAVVSYVVAGTLVLFSMRMLGELAIGNPEIGMFTDYARKYLGHGAGFVSGWLYWYFWMIVVAVEAIAGAIILQTWLPLPVWALGLGLLLCLTAVNLMSTRSYGEFEFWFSSIKVAAIIAFIAITGAYVLGFTGRPGPGLANLTAFGGFAPHGAVSVLAGVATVIFSLTGAEITTVAAAESKEPARAIASMTTTLTLRVVLFYVLSIFLIVCAVNWRTVAPGTSPFVTALAQVGIPDAKLMMNFIVLTAVLSCLNSGLYVTSRVLFALAAFGDAPKALTQLTRRRVPARAILTGSAFGYAAVIASVLSPAAVFSFLVNASGAAMLFLYLAIGIAQIQYRRSLGAEETRALPLRMWLYPWLSYAVLAGIAGILLAMAFIPDLRSQLTTTVIALAFLALIYVLFRRGRYASAQASARQPAA